ncbi:MAG: hypothetical protein JXC85_03065 [Candidatus Aenigmarchaeota archaeon]|nr:hypothetical protein [Candidatus Aenigmarchaeota archaeon]
MGKVKRGYCVEIGRRYSLDITRYGPGLRPYGIIEGFPVIIGDKENKQVIENPFSIQPGDRVIVEVRDIGKDVAFAKVEHHCGPFIHQGDRGNVTLSGQCSSDARDALSLPERGGGYCGVFTIVKRVDHRNSLCGGKPKECYVRIGALRHGKDNRYFAITNVLDESEERQLSRDIYVSQWPPPKFAESDEPLPEEDGIPVFEGVKGMKIGVPKYAGGILFFGDGGSKSIVTERHKNIDISYREPADAVDYFYEMLLEDDFRAALATENSMDSLKEAIEKSEHGLVWEDLPA